MNEKLFLQHIALLACGIGVVVYLANCALPVSNPLAPVAEGNIVFTRTVTNGTDIFMYGRISEDGHNITNLGSGWNEQPALSPNNSKIAFVSRRDGNRELYIMNIDGTGVTRLTNNSAWDIHPAWSPDGTKIAFVSNRDGYFNIYIMSADSGAPAARVTSNTSRDDSPCWSPDGSKLVFSSELGSSLSSPVPRLYTININGTGLTMISGVSDAHEIEPSWSIRNVIAYTHSTVTGGARIYTMQPDGSQVTQLSDSAGGWHPNWSDGGANLVFASDRSGKIRIYTMLASGDNIHQLIAKSDMVEFQPDWGTSLGGQ